MVALAANVFAGNSSEYEVFSKLNNKVAFNRLVIYLNADQEQIDYLGHVFKVTEEELKSAQIIGNAKMAESAMNYNLRNSKCILSNEQYRKYLVYVNLSLNNKSTDPLFENVLNLADNI